MCFIFDIPCTKKVNIAYTLLMNASVFLNRRKFTARIQIPFTGTGMEKFSIFECLSFCGAIICPIRLKFGAIVCVMRKQVYSFWCTLPRQPVYRDTQKYLGVFHFEIWPHLYVLKSPGFIYVIATAMNVCVREFECMCK